MNTIQQIERSSIVKGYHLTEHNRVDKILTEGLKINSTRNLTMGGEWATMVYGGQPIYFSTMPIHDKYDWSGAILEVDVVGFNILPDLPSLIDHGAYTSDEHGGIGLYWKYGQEPTALISHFLEENELEMFTEEDYLYDEAIINEFISITKTFTVTTNISPRNIKVYGDR